MFPTEPTRLTDWAQEPSLAELVKDAENARPFQQTHTARLAAWAALRDVTGKEAPAKVKGRSSIQPKLVRRQAEWRYAALSEPFNSAQNLFTISPVSFEDKAAAEQNQAVLNWQFRTKIDRIGFVDELVHTLVDEGTVIVQTGWRHQTEDVQEMAPVFSYFPITEEGQLQMLQDAAIMQTEDPLGFSLLNPEIQESVKYSMETGQPVFAQQVGEQEITVTKVLHNHPTVTVLDTANVTIDPSCQGDLSRALFVIVTFEANKAALQTEGPRYKNLDKIDWPNVTVATDSEHVSNTPADFAFADASRRKAVAREYWGYYDIHKTGNLVPIIATWIGKQLIRMEEGPFPDKKLPFTLIKYSPAKRSIYGEPDAELLADNQRILGAVTRGMIDLLGKSANGQTGFAKGMLDALQRQKYEAGMDYEFNPQMPVAQGMFTHTYPELPQSAFSMLALQTQEAESLSGVKGFTEGISGEGYGPVAAGVRGALSATAKREMAILRRLAKGIRDIGAKIIAMNQAFLSETEVVRVTNTEFIQIRREDLQGNFDLVVDIETEEVDAAKAGDLSFMLQTLGPKADPKMTTTILAEIARLKRMPELAHTLKNWKPEPNPMMEQMQQLELQAKKLENEKLRAEVGFLQARAALVKAQADATDLDFLEQESGTKHARDLERQHSQGQSNQALAVTKALLAGRKAEELPPDIEAAIGFNQFSKDNDTGQLFAKPPMI